MGWLRRLRATFGGSSVDRTLDDEIRFHIEQRTQQYVRTGMTQADAESEARRRFGSVSLAREAARDIDTVRWVGDVGQDVRYGLRQMRDNKRWTATVLLSLSLGIGANSALFSVIDAALLRSLPVGEPDELVFFDWTSGPRRMLASLSGVNNRDPATGALSSTSFSYQAFERFRAEATTLSDVIAFAPLDLNVNIDDHPAVATGQLVSGNYYRGLRVPAVLGRTIQNADDAPAAPPVAVITHRYWQRQFASDPTVVGKTISANGVPITIVGVSAPEFQGSNGFGTSADFSLPIALEARFRRPGSNGTEPWRWWVLVMGRLKPGVGRDQVQAELAPVFQTSAIDGWNAAPAQVRSSPSTQGPRDLPHLRVFPGNRGVTDVLRMTVRPLYVLMAIFWLLLAIACINVANLLLARSASRQREIGVRLALGASRGRVVRQLITESVLLAVVAGSVGAVLALWGTDLVSAFLPQNVAAVTTFRIDHRVLIFTAVISLMTGVLFGLAPAIRSATVDVQHTLKATTRTISRSHSGFAKSLLIMQVAMSVVLLVGAGLLLRTLHNLEQVDVGFDAELLLTFRVSPQTLKYDAARTAAVYEQMADRIRTVPGVLAVTTSTSPLVTNTGSRAGTYVQGSAAGPGGQAARIQTVRADYFATIGIPVVLGRTFRSSDHRTAPQVAVVNETFARHFLPATVTIGRRFGFDSPERSGDIEIVGIVKDVKDDRVRREITPTVYLSNIQQPIQGALFFDIRTAADPLAVVPAIRDAAAEVDPDLPLSEIKTQGQLIEESFAVERLLTRASTFFAGVALLLACIGLYGIMSYGVTQRTGEIGIRLALGAQRMHVVWIVVRDTLLVITMGAAIGTAASLGLIRLIASLLFGVTQTDPLTLALAVVSVFGIGALAAYLPARRASHTNPLIALRCE